MAGPDGLEARAAGIDYEIRARSPCPEDVSRVVHRHDRWTAWDAEGEGGDHVMGVHMANDTGHRFRVHDAAQFGGARQDWACRIQDADLPPRFRHCPG